MRPVKLEGEPPFALPALQGARAIALDDTVQMTVYVLSGEGDNALVPIHSQMKWEIAQLLAEELRKASVEAEATAEKRS
jgi:hypothetical protein